MNKHLQIFFKTIKERRISLIIYSSVSIVFLWMYVSLFPYMQNQAAELEKVFEAYPESFMDAFGIESTSMIFNKLENFLAMENFSMIWPIMVIAMIVAMGGYSIAGEVEKGTIETLLAQPVSRTKMFFEKYFAGLINLLIFTLLSIFAIFPLAKLYNIDYQAKNYLTLAIIGFLFGWTIFSISTFLSVVFNEKGKSYFITVGLVVVMYALNIVASLKDTLNDLKYASFFYYYDSSKALIENTIHNESYLVFGGAVLLFTGLALIAFCKKDVTV